MRAYGSDVVFYGADFETSQRHCLTLEQEQGLRFVSSGDEPLLVAKTLKPSTQVIGVQASGAPTTYLTWQAHARRTAPIQTFAGGLATGKPFMMPQQILWQHLDDFVLVDDLELMQGVRLFLEKAKTLAEPAGAAPLAAALRLREGLRGKHIALILSGGNIAPEELTLCLERTRQ